MVGIKWSTFEMTQFTRIALISELLNFFAKVSAEKLFERSVSIKAEWKVRRWRQYSTHSNTKEGCRRNTCCHTFARYVIAHLRRDIIRNSRWIRLSSTYHVPVRKSVSVQLSVYTNTPDYKKKSKWRKYSFTIREMYVASSCNFLFILCFV